MDTLEKENIFLIEFLIDQLQIQNSQFDLKTMKAETCIGFKFLNNGPFFICEDDFVPTKRKCIGGCSGCGNVKNGKSCLFSLTPDMIEKSRSKFDMEIELYKKMDPEQPPETPLGLGTASLVELFEAVLDDVAEGNLPSTKTLKNCYQLRDSSDELIAMISIYVRMSCFGKTIVTKFQMDYEDKTIDYRAKEGLMPNKYDMNQKVEDSCICPTGSYPCPKGDPKSTCCHLSD